MRKKTIFQISGMDCAPCSIAIDGALEDTEGVYISQTNYAKETTVVEFDPEIVSVKRLLAVIARAGYTASIRTVRKS